VSGPYAPGGPTGADHAASAAPITALGPAASGPVTTADRAGPDLKAAQSPGGGSLWASAWRRLRTDPVAILGFVIVAAFVVIALLAPVLAPYIPNELIGRAEIRPGFIPGPRDGHPLGFDRSGADELSKLLYGARQSLVIGVVATIGGLLGGLLLGVLAGAFGGWVDSVVMRLVDILLSVPQLLLAVSVAAILGQRPTSIMIAIAMTQVPIFARLLRGSMLSQRGADYVLAARSLGVRSRDITMSHVLPNSVGPVIVQATLILATVIIDVAALSFLGLGSADPNVAEWGRMLVNAQRELEVAPRLAFYPGIAIAVVALGFTLLGESLREALDPKNRR
jgi:peptide/nickel transport system permease protein